MSDPNLEETIKSALKEEICDVTEEMFGEPEDFHEESQELLNEEEEVFEEIYEEEEVFDEIYEDEDIYQEEEILEEEYFLEDVTKLWNKKDYFYKIDILSEDKIIKNFEAKINNSNLQVEDAFYSSLRFLPINEINLLREDPYIRERLECKKIRELNYQLLEINSKNCKEIEKYIQMCKICTDEDDKIIIKAVIKQKRRLDVLYNTVRNYIAEIIIKAEECYIFMESVWSTVFRKSLELATTEMSSQDCN